MSYFPLSPFWWLAGAGGLLLAGSSFGAPAARTHGGYYTEARLANARHNADTLDWAKQLRAEAVARAKPWLAYSDAELWAMVPGQKLGRCIDVTFDRHAQGSHRTGCLVCGDAIFAFGNYPYTPDFTGRPWKLTCPSCGAVFPTNDFGRFYRSALDEHGEFDPAKGDRTLLYNEAHPDPKDPLHLFGVDDGSGFIDGQGHAHRFIGYYAWKDWIRLYDGAHALGEAFVLTGEVAYAHKAAVLLDRIADVYPEMDWKPYADRGWYHSDGNRGLGKIEGSIWETAVVRKLAETYDAILSGTVGDQALWDFLAAQGRRYHLTPAKGTRELFVQHVDDSILRCAFQGVLDGRIRGNEGMQQLTVTACALALNTEPETTRWLDWLFEPGGGAIPGLMLGQLDRDGLSNEAAPGYALFWGESISEVAARLADFPSYTKHDIFRDFPPFRATFTAAQRLATLDRALPNLGDSGTTGLVTAARVNADFIAKGYRYTRDPELAVAAWRAHGGSGQGLGRDVYARDPEALGKEIDRITGQSTQRERPAGGDLLSGFGVALLESGRGAAGFSLVANYGRTAHHGHLDALNFDLFGYDHWLAPDLGYPEFATTWPNRDAWTINTLSHNTVVVDGQPQRQIWGGHVRLFERLPGLRVVQLEAAAYPQAKMYRRTLMLIDAPAGPEPRSYVVDIFQVRGGSDHVYSFHGPPGAVAADGLALEPQATGTYAGPDIPFAAPATTFPLGYSYLYEVSRDLRPGAAFQLDWQAETGYQGLAADAKLHVRLHALTACDDVALASGDPPQNKPGNPRRIRYALLHRHGPELESTFVNVIEPYRNQPFIRSVRQRPMPDSRQVAIEVTFVDGSRDVVLFNPQSGVLLRSPDGLALDGEMAQVRLDASGQPTAASLVHGREVKLGDWKLSARDELAGHVVAMNREITGGGWLKVDAELPIDGSLIGRQIMIANHGERDACYTIHGVRHEPGGSRVDCGPITFAHGFRGPTMKLRSEEVPVDYHFGYVYDFEPGAACVIPLSAAWRAPAVH